VVTYNSTFVTNAGCDPSQMLLESHTTGTETAETVGEEAVISQEKEEVPNCSDCLLPPLMQIIWEYAGIYMGSSRFIEEPKSSSFSATIFRNESPDNSWIQSISPLWIPKLGGLDIYTKRECQGFVSDILKEKHISVHFSEKCISTKPVTDQPYLAAVFYIEDLTSISNMLHIMINQCLLPADWTKEKVDGLLYQK
jgi:hypothetical protein